MTSLTCTSCQAVNPENSRFCNKCGKRVTDEFIDPELEARLLERIQSKLKEEWVSKDAVEQEIAFKAAARLSEWAKLFGWALGVPLAILALILASLGIKSTADLATIQSQSATLKKTSDELTKQYEPLKAQLPELTTIVAKLRDLDKSVKEIINDIVKSRGSSSVLATPAVQTTVAELQSKIDALSDQQSLALARTPPVEDEVLDQALLAQDPTKPWLTNPKAARAALKFRVTMMRDPVVDLRKWEQALP